MISWLVRICIGLRRILERLGIWGYGVAKRKVMWKKRYHYKNLSRSKRLGKLPKVNKVGNNLQLNNNLPLNNKAKSKRKSSTSTPTNGQNHSVIKTYPNGILN